jgi:LemA protein
MKRILKKVMLGILIALVVFGIFWWARSNYRKAAVYVINVKSNWSDVEDQLSQRTDLIPALMDEVKKYTKDESDLLNAIDEEKQKYSQAQGMEEKLQAYRKLEGDVAKLLQIAEKYPALAKDDNFLKTKDDWASSQKAISFEETKYNENVRLFKKYKGSFFGSIFMKAAGLSNEKYEEIQNSDMSDR